MGLYDLFSSGSHRNPYDSHERLFEGLKNMDNMAIVHLQSKSFGAVRKAASAFGLPESQTEEILNASTLIFLRKI